MTITYYEHGWLTRFEDDCWVYADTGQIVKGNPRPCPRCGRMPTLEGYDACLGYIPGAQSACCGHGVHEGFVVWNDERYERLQEAAT